MSEYGTYPYGLRNVVVTDENGANFATLSATQTFSFQERIRSEEFSGDDGVLAVGSYSDAVEWTVDAGGMSLDAIALMTGRTIVETGSTPNRTSTLTGNAGEAFPYFRIYGKSLADGADDVHCVIYRCKLTGPLQGKFGDGEFWVTQFSGIGISDGVNGIFDFVQNETAGDLYASLGSGALGMLLMGVKS